MSQEAKVFPAGAARGLNYLLYLPERYGHDSSQRWPLILFLHGSGERGSDPELVKAYGLPKKIDSLPDFPFIVVSPQCPENMRWTELTLDVRALLEHIIRGYAVDPDRVYLTGLSMGGQGTWCLGVVYPKTFAAIAPICGRIPPDTGVMGDLCRLKDVPAWIFHGAKDEVVPVENSEKCAAALKQCGGDVRLTIYPEADHNSWDNAYAEPDLFPWFLSHTRNQS